MPRDSKRLRTLISRMPTTCMSCVNSTRRPMRSPRLTGKFDKGVKYLNDAIANGYESNGEAYYYLYHCYRAQKDFEKAKEALVAGLGKYPKNNQILEQLIVLYSETGEGLC